MAERNDGHEEQIDRLYALPLGEFTAARDELARRLRGEGERDAAAEVKRLRKPSVAAWALNQVRRSDPQQVDELIAAGRRLREAQDQLLAGGDREPLDQASDAERQLVGELARRAERELESADRSVTAAVQEKLRSTLHAVATDEEARERLASGRLVGEHAPSALGPLLDTEGRPGPAPRREREKRAPKEAPTRRARQLTERLERTRAKQRELDEELSEAGRRLRDARREAARAASALERAEAAEERARRRVEETGDRAAELEAALREL
jgi:hypothetical protein